MKRLFWFALLILCVLPLTAQQDAFTEFVPITLDTVSDVQQLVELDQCCGLFATFSDSGRYVATTGDAIIRVWDLQEGVHIATLDQSLDSRINSAPLVRDMRFVGEDESTLVIFSSDEQMREWDFLAGESSTMLHIIGDGFGYLIDPNKPQWYYGDNAGFLQIIDLPTNQSLASYSWFTTPLSMSYLYAEMAMTPDGETLVAATRDGQYGVWRTGDRSGTAYRVESDFLSRISISNDGRVAAVSASDGPFVFDTETGEIRFQLGTDEWGFIGMPRISPDGSLLVGVIDENLTFWDTQTGELVHQVEQPLPYVTLMTFSLDGTMLIFGSEYEPFSYIYGITPLGYESIQQSNDD